MKGLGSVLDHLSSGRYEEFRKSTAQFDQILGRMDRDSVTEAYLEGTKVHLESLPVHFRGEVTKNASVGYYLRGYLIQSVKFAFAPEKLTPLPFFFELEADYMSRAQEADDSGVRCHLFLVMGIPHAVKTVSLGIGEVEDGRDPPIYDPWGPELQFWDEWQRPDIILEKIRERASGTMKDFEGEVENVASRKWDANGWLEGFWNNFAANSEKAILALK